MDNVKSTKDAYYECKRCFYNCYQKTDMTRHINKKKKCERILKSFDYKDEDITELSLKRYSGTNVIINNNIQNNIQINMNTIHSFNDKWNTDHITPTQKLLLLLNNSKFTETLNQILENDMNLNVLIDNTSDNAIVYQDKQLVSMKIKDIVKKTLEKIFVHLTDFKDDIIEPNIFNIDKNIMSEQIKIANTKIKDYNKDIDIQKYVNIYIKDIYNKKKDDTLFTYKLVNNEIGY